MELEMLNFGSQVMPVDALGFNYYAMSWWASRADKRYGQIGVTATEDGTRVRIVVLRKKNVKFTYAGVVYDENQPLVVTLDKHETFQVQDVHFDDITGTKIEADKPVAVFSGHVQSNVGGGSVDHVVDQMAPLHSWGTRFGVVPFPGQTSDYRIKFIALAADTAVRVSRRNEAFDISRPGDSKTVTVGAAEYLSVTASKPLLLAQYVPGRQAGDGGAPSVVLVPPLEQFKSSYTFSVPTGAALTSYVMVVVLQTGAGFLQLDGRVLSTSWTSLPETVPVLVGTAVVVGGGAHTVAVAPGGGAVTFGAYVYGHADDDVCAYAYQAGMCLADIRNVSGDSGRHGSALN